LKPYAWSGTTVAREAALFGLTICVVLCAPASGQFDQLRHLGQKVLSNRAASQKAKADTLEILKETGANELTRTQRLLDQAPGYDSRGKITLAMSSLEDALTGKNTKEIQKRTDALIVVTRDLDLFVQTVSAAKRHADELATVLYSAGEELTKTRRLMRDGPGYDAMSQVTAAQSSLELAIAGKKVEEIADKTQALVAVDSGLNHYIEIQNATAIQEAADRRAAEVQKAAAELSEPQVRPKPRIKMIAPIEKAQVNTSPQAQSQGLPEALALPVGLPLFDNHSGKLRSIVHGLSIILLLLLGVDGYYCLYKGLHNQLVLYVDKTDVFVSILGPVLLFLSLILSYNTDNTIVALLAIIGVSCSVITIWSSIKYNKALPVGCSVAFFKMWFSFLWFPLMLVQLGRVITKRHNGSPRLGEAGHGLVLAFFNFNLIERLINGPAVYAMSGSQAHARKRHYEGANRDESESRWYGDRTSRAETASRQTGSNPPSGDDHYRSVLGVPSTAGQQEVKARFKELLKKYHPDKVNHLGKEFIEIAAKKTQELIEAYEFLERK
jgi:hypothetical protein